MKRPASGSMLFLERHRAAGQICSARVPGAVRGAGRRGPGAGEVGRCACWCRPTWRAPPRSRLPGVLPVFPEYWRTGPAKLTADVVAAVEGLFAGRRDGRGRPRTATACRGGRTSSRRPSHRGPSWRRAGSAPRPTQPRIRRHVPGGPARPLRDARRLPEPHRRLRLPGRGGRRADHGKPRHRRGVVGGRAGAGHLGDAALGRELNGALAGTPFLAVKRSTSRVATAPVHADPAAGAGDPRLRPGLRPAVAGALGAEPAGAFAVEISLDRGRRHGWPGSTGSRRRARACSGWTPPTGGERRRRPSAPRQAPRPGCWPRSPDSTSRPRPRCSNNRPSAWRAGPSPTSPRAQLRRVADH